MNNFGDKEMLTDALDAEKSATCLYNTFANECVNPSLRETFMNLLEKEHNIQFDVFNEMHARGLYPTPAAEQQKVDQAKQKHAAQANC